MGNAVHGDVGHDPEGQGRQRPFHQGADGGERPQGPRHIPTQTTRISRSVVCRCRRCGYAWGMSPIEAFIEEVEVSITDAVDSLGQEESARLYADVLDVEQRLEALRDALAVLAVAGT